MPHVTRQLGREPGIQYQGVVDASSSVENFPVVGLITGAFRRGRFDKPMLVNLRNIRALLGHDTKNPDYMAVFNALNDGAPSVHVLRIGDRPLPPEVEPEPEGLCIETGHTPSRHWYIFLNQEASVDDLRDVIQVYIDGNPTQSYNLREDGAIKINVPSMQSGQTLKVCLPFYFELDPENW